MVLNALLQAEIAPLVETQRRMLKQHIIRGKGAYFGEETASYAPDSSLFFSSCPVRTGPIDEVFKN
jgi:hypothetical protein